MKVTFLFSGLPLYLIGLLNRLVSAHGVEVSLIIPRQRGISIGEGVRQGDLDHDYLFSIYRVEEYRGKLNKPYFRNLHQILEEISPDILVMGWPYIINYSFDSNLRKTMKKNNISLVLREIPFMVAPRNQAMKYYRNRPIVNEDLEIDNPVGLKFYPWAFGLNQVRKKYYRLVDATMIYASHGFQIHESFGIKRDHIFLTYNTPDTELIAKIRKNLIKQGAGVSNPRRILHLGRLVKWKRVDLIIEAVALLSETYDNIELCIIGSGPEEENLKALAGRKAPGVKITFAGAIYDAETLAREILSSAIYVLGGMGGLSINEAMAYGKPVICSRCDGTERDLIQDQFNGLFFREGDAAHLASKIEILLKDPEKGRTMGENGRSVIEEKINLKTVSQRFTDCFDFLMQSKHP
jgi:glycosyltransferase involved in cell wall biosynthesis